MTPALTVDQVAAAAETVVIICAVSLFIAGGTLAPVIIGGLLGFPALYGACLNHRMARRAAAAQRKAAAGELIL